MKRNSFFLSVFFSLIITGLFSLQSLSGQAPEHYYDSAINKSGFILKHSLHNIIRNHITRTYDQIWTDFGSTDTDENGKVIDIYAGCDFTFPASQCSGSGTTGQCICYNREHSFPKSWFYEDYPMYTDLFHLYPTEGYTNTRRSNNPYGETNNPTYTSPNGGKLGPSSFPGYSDVVFEPKDEFKGDLARTYFYMATCYENKIEWWSSPMLGGNRYEVFTSWAKELLLKWHRQDPVSAKETKRNEAVFTIQGNRNPFIDHPELVEKIWGKDPRCFTTEEEEAFDPEKVGDLYIDFEIKNESGQTVKSGSVAVPK